MGTAKSTASAPVGELRLTPVERHGDYWVKRDDLYAVAGVRGGKARTCWRLAQGATGLVTAGSRSSPQVNIVAHVAAALGIPCQVHTPQGELSPEVAMAKALGADVVQHKAGYNSVICARAEAAAKETGWRLIPFGMECAEAVEETSAQVANLPDGIARIVVPVGSGMSLCGIAHGVVKRYGYGSGTPEILGISVGADPNSRFARYMPWGWPGFVEIRPATTDYHKSEVAPPAIAAALAGVPLDAHYEAKAAAYLLPGDLFWVVGIRKSQEVQT